MIAMSCKKRDRLPIFHFHHTRPWRNWIAHRSSEPRVAGSNPAGRIDSSRCEAVRTVPISTHIVGFFALLCIEASSAERCNPYRFRCEAYGTIFGTRSAPLWAPFCRSHYVWSRALVPSVPVAASAETSDSLPTNEGGAGNDSMAVVCRTGRCEYRFPWLAECQNVARVIAPFGETRLPARGW